MNKHQTKLAALFIVALMLSFLCGAIYVKATSPGLTFAIYGGPYPGAASYTIFTDGSLYYAKDATGAVDFQNANLGIVVNAAYGALNQTGGLIQFAPGETFYLDATLDNSYYDTNIIKPTNNTILDLGGSELTVTVGDDCAILVGSYYVGFTDQVSVENVTIRNGRLNNLMNQAQGIGFCTEGSSHIKDVRLQNLDIEMPSGSALNFAAIAIECSPTATANSYIKNFVVDNVRVVNCRTGVQVQGVTAGTYNTVVTDLHVRNSYFENCPYGAVWVRNIDINDYSVENNVMIDCGVSYGAIALFEPETGAAVYKARNVLISGNSIQNPTVAAAAQYGIIVSENSYNVKVLNNIVENTSKNGVYVVSNVGHIEIAGNTINSTGSSFALIYMDYNLTCSDMVVHDNFLPNTNNQKWLETNNDSPVYAYNNVPYYPIVCSSAMYSDKYSHMVNNFALSNNDTSEFTPGVALSAGVSSVTVSLSTEMREKIKIAATPYDWAYYISGIVTTWNTTSYVSAKTTTNFTITFGTVTPGAGHYVFYTIETIV